MRYVSTRGQAPALEFGDVLLTGLATDGGLYVPERYPVVDRDRLAAMTDLSYTDLAVEIMFPFVEGSISLEDFAPMVEAAYSSFSHPDVIPLLDLGDNHWLMELFHGPTLAFKDVALQLVGRLFDHELTARGQRVTIVAATSGDTGSAAIEACRDRDTVDIFVLFPNGRVSDVQRRQMTSVDSANVHCVAIEGTFDDCQDMVKAMFADPEFRAAQQLSAVNSINWARVMAQVVYYWWAALKLGRLHEPTAFAVPTGNFGNVFAGSVARRMGLPVSQFVIGSNRNDILTRFLATGEMVIESVEPSLSPSMDIQVSSNLERLLFELFGRDGQAVAEFMTQFRDEGAIALDPYKLAALRETWDGIQIDDEGTTAVISDIFARRNLVIDPHTAVGVGAAEACRRSATTPIVTLATAHPAKFPDAVEKAIDSRPDLPPHLADLFERQERFEVLPNDLVSVQRYVAQRSRATT